MCKLVTIQSNTGESIRVADIKKHYIQNIIFNAPKCKSIDAIILFGSALEERCTENSVIVIVIISKYTLNKLCSIKSYSDFMKSIYELNLSQEYDKLYFKSFTEIEQKESEVLICKELLAKGKTIYRKAG